MLFIKAAKLPEGERFGETARLTFRNFKVSMVIDKNVENYGTIRDIIIPLLKCCYK